MFLPFLQSFLALVNLLSFPAVYELTANQELPNKAEYSLREVPTCIIVSHFLSTGLFSNDCCLRFIAKIVNFTNTQDTPCLLMCKSIMHCYSINFRVIYQWKLWSKPQSCSFTYQNAKLTIYNQESILPYVQASYK